MAVPVSLADARRQLRMEADDNSRDAELQPFIDDAAGWVEQYTGHIFVAKDVTDTFDAYDGRLSGWPIKPNATIAVSYGVPGSLTAITGARLRLSGRPARIRPAAGAYWPVLPLGGVVQAVYRAGYEAGDVVPRNLRRAMLVLIGGYDADREGGDVFAAAEETARGLCSSFRARSL